MTVFDSRKKEYKSKISAVATAEKVKLRIIVPRSMGCSNAVLCVTKEDEDPVRYGMFWAGMCGDDSEHWELHFSADTPGLYWYHFELDTPWGRSFVRNVGSGIGGFDPDGSDFQQTVYSADFKTPDWFRGGIIYQIFPDRFFSSGTKKQCVRPSRVMRKWGDEPYWQEEQMNGLWNNDYFGGDLKGIEEKLPYIAELGVTCIYLNPIFEANSNHRYDTADYEKTDPLLGTEDDLKSLCAEAEKLGISIILDGVFSHTGCDSKYFNMFGNYDCVGAYNSPDSPYYDWYSFTKYPDEYKSWWNIKLLPEVCEENESYRSYICSENGILRKWLRCGIRGWRLDVADELPDVFLDELRCAVKDEKPDAVIIGEVWEDATTKFAYGKRRRYFLGKQLDSVMNYPFADAILNFVKFGNANRFFDSVMSIVEHYPPCVTNLLMNHIGTHDTERAITRLAAESARGRNREWQHAHNKLSSNDYRRGKTLLRLASLLQFTLPGVPSVYYGDEIGMQGMKDPFNRGCMQWNKPDEDLLRWYRRLGEIRRGTTAFADGEFLPLCSCGDAAVFLRSSESGTVLVAVNAGVEEKELFVGKEWDNSYPIFGKSSDGSIVLKAYGYALLIK